MSKVPKAFPGIEVLRFLCSLAVLFWHYRHFFHVGDKTIDGWEATQQPLYGALKPFYEHGQLAVEIFWAISGFIFFWKYGAVVYDRAISFRKFWLLRLSRLYPLHFATLIFVAIAQGIYRKSFGSPLVYLNNDLFHFVLNLFFANWWGLSKSYTFNGPSWSISVEIFAYLIFFLVASSFRYSMKTVIAAFVISVALWKQGLMFFRFAECLSMFFMGGILYGVVQMLESRPAARNRVAQISGFLVLATVIIGYRGTPKGVSIDFELNTIVFICTPALLLAALLAFPRPESESSRKRVEALGDLTYASYMIHFPIQLVMVFITNSMGLSRNVYKAAWMPFLFVGLTLILARLVFRYFEMPAQDFMRRRLADKPVTANVTN